MNDWIMPDGRSYEINKDGVILKIDGKPPTKEDRAALKARGYRFEAQKEVKKEVKDNVTTRT